MSKEMVLILQTVRTMPNNFIDTRWNNAGKHSSYVADDFVQNNLVAISQDLQATNDCDEADDGVMEMELTADCINNVENTIGPVDQSNFATRS